ncbi:MAG: carbohydrate ABC transporter substrate-binding protein [Caldilineales bacterium]|nr:carbohydrate ABC transporter substrate-binding protein [Caldilineales bacterium]
MRDRRFLTLIVIALAVVLTSACTPPDPTALTTPTINPLDSEEALSANLEVFSPGTGAEATAIEALAGLVQRRNPEIDVVLVMPEAGDLRTRQSSGQPPDIWLTRIGREFIGSQVATGQVEPLNALYEQTGLNQVFSPDVMKWLGDNTDIYSLPVAIHRANLLWYNPKVLAAAGVSGPPATLLRFPDVLEELRAAGVADPLVLGERSTVVQLFESMLVAHLGPRAYAGLWTGETDWQSEEVVMALDDFAVIMNYTNSDAIALNWQQAAQRVAAGGSAFFIAGDWVKGLYDEMGLVEGEDYDWTTAPGTAASFVYQADGFVQSSLAPHLHNAPVWMETAASPAGQAAFSRALNALPAIENVSRDQLNDFQQASLDDWERATRVGSMAYGLVINRAWRAAIGQAIDQFQANRDIESMHNNLVQACREYGPCE